jgi:hypothetical protein
MSVQPQSDAFVAIDWTVAAGSPPPSIGEVLRSFNDLRERLTIDVCGMPGVGIGFDELDLDEARLRSLPSGASVTASATLR